MFKVELVFYVESITDIKPALERMAHDSDELPETDYYHTRFKTSSGDRLLVTVRTIDKDSIESDIDREMVTHSWSASVPVVHKKAKILNN